MTATQTDTHLEISLFVMSLSSLICRLHRSQPGVACLRLTLLLFPFKHVEGPVKHLSRTLKFRLSAGSCTQRANCTNMVFFLWWSFEFQPNVSLFIFQSRLWWGGLFCCLCVFTSSQHPLTTSMMSRPLWVNAHAWRTSGNFTDIIWSIFANYTANLPKCHESAQ